MEWVRGGKIGHGSFGSVSLAIATNQNPQIPPLMAVKSCGFSHSASLMSEKLILDELKDCPEIITCFGDSISIEHGEKLYNVTLEYAAGGALADKLKNSGDCGFPESDIRRFTNSILKGICYIHKNGYVHCDIKLQNILVFGEKTVKIADFGLAKKAGVKEGSKYDIRGTPLYMSPEMVVGGEQESPADIWALGCLVAEMVTGAPAWKCSDVGGLLMRIGVGEEMPEIPGKISEKGKDFLGKCFLKDPKQRWTAEMLLNHPFVADHGRDTLPLKDKHDQVSSTSPRSPFGFSNWVSVQSTSLTCSSTSLPSPESSPEFDSWFGGEFSNIRPAPASSSKSPASRLRELMSDQRPDRSVSSSWITVR